MEDRPLGGLLERGADREQAEDLQELKKWPVGERIGQGAFGDAFLLADPKTKKKYVLKRIRMARQNEWQRTATRQEIKLGSMLQHPFIVRFVNSWIRDGHEVNLVYDFCSQGDLQTLLRKQKAKHTDELQLRRWLAELLLALHYLQSKQVLHRDLKSSNIFLTADNDVQIGDFGLATIRDVQDSSCHDQSIVGTPHFMSPEVLNRKKYDFKTDIWSLGCVIYELSALRSPFNAFNLNGLVSKICKSAVAPLPSQYSEGWNSVVKWMLKKSVNKRPSVEDLLASDELRGDVLWARERALQLTPGVVLPPLPTPTPLLRQPSGCGVGQDDDVLCAADDGVHTPLQGQLLQPFEQYAVSNPKDRGHGQIHCVDEAIYQPDEAVKTGQQVGHCSDGSSTPVSGREWLLGVTRPQPASKGIGGGAGTAVVSVLPVPLADHVALTPESGVRPLPAAGNRGHVLAVAMPGPSILSKAAADGAADRKGAEGKQQPEPSAVLAADSAKGAKPAAAAAGTQRARRASASITAAAAAAPTAEGLAASTVAAPTPPSRAAGAPGIAAGAPQPAVAGAASTVEGGLGASAVGAAVRARVSRPRSAPREASDVSRLVTAAGGNRIRAAARQVAQGKPGAATPAGAQAGMPHSSSGAGSPENVASQPVATCDDSMDVDPPADRTSNSPCAAAVAALHGPSVGATAAAAAAQSFAPVARAKLPVQRHTALSQARAGSIERRGAGATGAAAAPQPRYRDAAKAVAAAAAAEADTAGAQVTDARGARTVLPAGPASGDPLDRPVNATATGNSNSVPAAAPAAEANQPGQCLLAGLRAARRPVSSRISPVRRAPRSNSAGGARAAVGADGLRTTLDAGRSRQPATLLARPGPAATQGRARTAGVAAPPVANAATVASDAMLQQEQQCTTDSAAASGSSPACSASDVASEAQPSAPDVAHAALAVMQQLRQPQPRRNSYISVSGQQLCEEFSLLSLPPPEEVVARSSSCSSLMPRRPAASGRSCHSQSPTSTETELLPLASPFPARQVGHPTVRSRLQSAAAAIGDVDAGMDSSAEATVRQRSAGAASASATVSASDLSPAVALPATAYAAARAAAQQPQLFDNQLWNSSPNTRKAGQHGGGRVGGGTPDSPLHSSMSVEVTGPAREWPTPSHEVVSSVTALPEAWAPSDGPADQTRADLITRATISAGGASGEACIRPQSSAAPASDAGVVLQPSAATAELSFGGFKPAPGPGPFSLPVAAETSTPAFPARTLAPASQQPSSDTSLMSVSFASSDLLSVTRRLEMPSVSQGNSDDLAAVPGSLGKWMTPRAARDEAQSAVRGKAAFSPTAMTSRSQAVVARILSPTTASPSQRSQHRLTLESSGGGGEAGKETDGTKERLATLERVVALASRLHAMGRWHELGNVLSSTQPQAPGSEGGGAVGVAAGPDGKGAVVPGFLPSSNMVPCITSPNGGTRALNVGDKVIVGSRRGIATIRYWGPCHWAAGDYVGLELDRPEGKHQGEVDGICYFRCLPLHGIFVKSSMLKPANT